MALLVQDYVAKEGFLKSFSVMYPRPNDTIAYGLEGWIKYDHHPDGYSTVVTIYGDRVYIDYDDVDIKASDPEFFTKLKGVLSRHEAVHANCQHMRSLGD